MHVSVAGMDIFYVLFAVTAVATLILMDSHLMASGHWNRGEYSFDGLRKSSGNKRATSGPLDAAAAAAVAIYQTVAHIFGLILSCFVCLFVVFGLRIPKNLQPKKKKKKKKKKDGRASCKLVVEPDGT